MALYLCAKDRLNTVTQAYLYKWTHIPTQKWYVGSRTAIGCHINDGYICSSSLVKPMIIENKSEWMREVLCIGTSKYIRELETTYLTAIDAKNDPISFNRNNADGNFLGADRTGKNNSFYGKHHTEKNKQHLRNLYLGTIRPDSIKIKISSTLTGRIRPDQDKKNIAIGVAKLEKKKCVHCGKYSPPGPYGRWHGENCKIKGDHDKE